MTHNDTTNALAAATDAPLISSFLTAIIAPCGHHINGAWDCR